MRIKEHNLCISCMHPLGEERVCSFCGFEQETYNQIPRCLAPGTILADRYVTGRVLGEGSFGITYIGWDMVMEIPIAVKEYFPSDMVSRDVICGSDNRVYLYENEKTKNYAGQLEKFLNEAKCLSRFNQVKGIVSVRDFFYENGTAYIVMQYIDGISVKRYVEKNGKIEANRVLAMMYPVLVALEQVHNSGIIHRDISPDNMLITREDSLVLIDFGAARLRNVDSTKTMTVMFKRGFSPEEQYRTKGKWGPYTDVYSICATMYYMMTGVVPADSVIRVLEDDMPSLVSMKKLGITLQQCKVIMKGLAVAPQDRYQTIRELCGDLYGEELAYGVDGGRPDDGMERMDGRKKFFWSHPAVRVGIVLAAVVLVLGCVWVLMWMKPTEEKAASGLPTAVTAGGVKAEPSGSIKQDKGRTEKQGRVSVKVPTLTGIKLEKAEEKLDGKKLKYKIKRVASEEEKGTVIRQSIRKGKVVEEGTRITLTVSKGKESVPTARPTSGRTGGNSSKNSNTDDFAGIIQ